LFVFVDRQANINQGIELKAQRKRILGFTRNQTVRSVKLVNAKVTRKFLLVATIFVILKMPKTPMNSEEKRNKCEFNEALIFSSDRILIGNTKSGGPV
jgi:hypothetical protein